MPRGRSSFVRAAVLIGVFTLCLATSLWAADPPPSSTSHVGDTVTNPATGATTTVSALIVDPAGTPTAGATALVRTADGYVFVVKGVGQFIYNSDTPPLGFKIVSADAATHTVQIDADPPGGATAPLSTQMTFATYQSLFFSSGTPGAVTPPVSVTLPTGVTVVEKGNGGSNGRDGALVVPPESGGDGATGPAVNYTTSFNISATNQIGLEAGSLGGKGGSGGDSYLSVFDGRDGGDGGKGGAVTVTNAAGVQISTTGGDSHGIFAYSRSGEAGNDHAEPDGNLQAYDAANGDLLWQYQLGFVGPSAGLRVNGGGPVATFETGGDQYVALTMNRIVWAFKLGGTVPPRPAPPRRGTGRR
jgi:hypothetical protein